MFGCRHAKDYSQQKNNALKEFYAEISRAQARTPGDWYRCSCGSIVHASYKDSHVKTKHISKIATFTKIDSVNGLDTDNGILTVEESLSKLTKACEGCVGDEACCAIAGLKAAGWDVEINPAMAHGNRKGYMITILEPKKG